MDLSEVADLAVIANYFRSLFAWIRKKIKLLKQRAIGRYQARQSQSKHLQEIDKFLGQIADNFKIAQEAPNPQERASAIETTLHTLGTWFLEDNHRCDLSQFSAAKDLETRLVELSAALIKYKRITDELNNPQIQRKSFSRDAPAEARTGLNETLEQITSDISELRKQLQKRRSN